MKLEYRSALPVAAETAWALVGDVPRVARCIPGLVAVVPVAADRYTGTLKVSVGPIRLTLVGDVSVTTRDEATRMLLLHAAAADRAAGGAVSADVRLAVSPGAEPRTCELVVTTDAQIMGKIGEFGQPIVKRKADQTMAEFVANLGRALV